MSFTLAPLTRRTGLGLATLSLAALAMSAAHPAAAQTTLTGTYKANNGNFDYTNASSIAVSATNDLVYNLAPTATNYAGRFEANGGTAAPFTDGQTSTDGSSSQATSPTNALFDPGSNWFTIYTLGSNPGGYDLSSIVVTSGHKDNRVNQGYDILVKTLTGSTTFTSLSGGTGYTYAPVPIGNGIGSGGAGGGTQSTVTETGGGLLATGVTSVEFVTTDNGNGVYREFGAFGSPTPASAAPEPSQTAGLGFAVLGVLGLLWKAKKRSASELAG